MAFSYAFEVGNGFNSSVKPLWRSDRNAARISVLNSSGYSHAAK